MNNGNITKQKKGFALYPENINRKGRPKKGYTLTEAINKELDKINPETGKTNREEFARRLVTKAIEGDVSAMQLVLKYVDGLPKKQVDSFQEPKILIILPDGKNFNDYDNNDKNDVDDEDGENYQIY